MKTREERERDLVALLLNDRPALDAEYRRVKQLPTDSNVAEVSEYDLVHQSLDIEYGHHAKDYRSTTDWLDARSSM